MQQNPVELTARGGEIRRLANGLTVLLESLPHVRSVSAGVWIRAGSVNESPREHGISHFLEHLFFKGTSTRSARKLMEEIEGRGGDINAFTARDYTCVYAKVLDLHILPALDILADILIDSQLFDFEKERNVILEEIASVEDVPEEYVHDLLVEKLWPASSFGRPVAGSIESVSAITVEDVRDYYRRWYRPENMIVSVVGNIDTEAVYEHVAARFAPLNGVLEPARLDAPCFAPGAHYAERPISQSHVCFAFPGVPVTADRRRVFDVLSSVLGGGATSRLFDRIRESEGLAYSIYTFNSCYSQGGFIGAYAALAPENLERALDLAFEELRKLKQEPLGADELSLNREQLKVGFLMGLESTYTRMCRQARDVMNHGRILSVDEILGAVDRVTSEEIQQLACELFEAERCSLVVLGPTDGAEQLGIRL